MTSSQQGSSPLDRVPLRIRIDGIASDSPLDGAWWPQSSDLQAECADLIDHLPEQHGRVARLLFSRPDWEAGQLTWPRAINAARGRVKIGSFPGDDTHLMTLVLNSRARLHLLVIPSETKRGVALTLMSQAADSRNRRSASDLLDKVAAPA
ncbi:DUF5994 family protein [Pimelobacter simplex]|uniref:DUF5994 family protein n=2 Tax=Nocardioides simplex TaxID=2045 RepID=UPI000535F9AB|nr:DUF5994 family protein [Pimelobacter simplex]GEB12593.1 hypothetical protein NSI01_09080 [Pimelobacter simplex]